jgi:hypothetical protein
MSRLIMAIAFAVAAFGLDAAQQNLFPYAELKDGKISDLTRGGLKSVKGE